MANHISIALVYIVLEPRVLRILSLNTECACISICITSIRGNDDHTVKSRQLFCYYDYKAGATICYSISYSWDMTAVLVSRETALSKYLDTEQTVVIVMQVVKYHIDYSILNTWNSSPLLDYDKRLRSQIAVEITTTASKNPVVNDIM